MRLFLFAFLLLLVVALAPDAFAGPLGETVRQSGALFLAATAACLLGLGLAVAAAFSGRPTRKVERPATDRARHLRLLSREDATPEVLAECRAALDDGDPRVVRAAQEAILRLDRAQRAGRKLPVRDLGPLTAADIARRRALRRRM